MITPPGPSRGLTLRSGSPPYHTYLRKREVGTLYTYRYIEKNWLTTELTPKY